MLVVVTGFELRWWLFVCLCIVVLEFDEWLGCCWFVVRFIVRFCFMACCDVHLRSTGFAAGGLF